MSVDLCVLASGSAGNCTLVRTPGGTLLIDIGIGPRTASERLAGTGLSVADVAAVCLTHLDSDHFNSNWSGTLHRHGVGIHCHVDGADEVTFRASHRGSPAMVSSFDLDPFEPLPGLTLHPIPLAHDASGSHGFLLEGFGCRIGYATDLGRVPDELIEQFCDLDLLAIESNYDPKMQLNSPRPGFLKHRIMGGHGHLSNAQAFDAVRKILNRCTATGGRLPEHIVLLHRSRDCNCPDLLRSVFSKDSRIAPRLVLAEQFERTPWLKAARQKPHTGEQLALAFG
jgi:phosphoribosyl 1,2-cyclic phosphodiesterase